jgi:hypothetical protein
VGAAFLAAVGSWLGNRAGRAEPGAGRRGSRAAWAGTVRRYWLALAVATTTAGVLAGAHAQDGRLSVPFMVVVLGGPVTALLLARASAGVRGGFIRTAAAFLFGGTVVAALTLLLYPPVTALTLRIGSPPIGAALRALDSMIGGLVPVSALAEPGSAALVAFTVVASPLVEELVKPAGGVAVNPRSRGEAFAVCAASGAGFAAVENVVAAFGDGAFAWLPVSAMRTAASAVPVVGAGIMGLAIYDHGRPTRALSLPRALCLAGMLHAAWNAIVTWSSLIGGPPRSVPAGAPSPEMQWGLVVVVGLAAVATLAVAGIIRVGVSSRSAAPIPMLGVRSLLRPSPAVAAAWAVLGLTLAVPIAWGVLDGRGHFMG